MSNLSSPEHAISDPARPVFANHVEVGQCSVVTTLTSKPSRDGHELRIAGDIEVRADLVHDVDPALLRTRARATGELSYNLRSVRAGGAFEGDARERARRLLGALEHYDVIDLEADRDLTPDILARIPPHRRRISWHGTGCDMRTLTAQFERMARTPARLYLLAPDIRSAEDALVPLQLLKRLRRSDVTAFGTARAGIWSRLLAPRLGAPIVYGRLHGNDEFVPTVDQLTSDYRLPALLPLKHLFAIVGRSAGASMSPKLHNTGYRAIGFPALYVPMPVDDFGPFWSKVVDGLGELGFSLDGLTVVSPHKEAALGAGARASKVATHSGAANLLVRTRHGWRAHSTNAAGVLGALRSAGVRLAGQKAAVIGCGGAGRAAAWTLLKSGVRPDVINRGAERGHYAAQLLGLTYVPLRNFAPENYSLIVHATTLRDEAPFAVEQLSEGTVLLDMGYGAKETALVAAARARTDRRLVIIDGWAMLSADAAEQFQKMTGRRMPVRDARIVLSSNGN
ncbi:type I 3-dehydroquinate dehydratase [Pendulispora albinea]|uniref:Type I 3-dehydroquinate dehydratase n=1 Tax=Pendulispora albinea TaxID=2741071 RepID=A0ABZ2MBH9_9BACT